jgi:hypothetical protein
LSSWVMAQGAHVEGSPRVVRLRQPVNPISSLNSPLASGRATSGEQVRDSCSAHRTTYPRPRQVGQTSCRAEETAGGHVIFVDAAAVASTLYRSTTSRDSRIRAFSSVGDGTCGVRRNWFKQSESCTWSMNRMSVSAIGRPSMCCGDCGGTARAWIRGVLAARSFGGCS